MIFNIVCCLIILLTSFIKRKKNRVKNSFYLKIYLIVIIFYISYDPYFRYLWNYFLNISIFDLNQTHRLVNFLQTSNIYLFISYTLVFSIYLYFIETYEDDFNFFVKKYIKNEDKEKMSEKIEQLAHDIKSPLSALEILINNISDIPEEQKKMLRQTSQKIGDMANSFISEKNLNSHIQEVKTFMVSNLIELVLSEKRVQYSECENIKFKFINKGKDIFLESNPTTIYRVLSNLINNSVEALERKGLVTLSLESINLNKFIIVIEDDGKGMTDEQKKISFTRGISFGKEELKESGSGLGLYHAKEVVNSLKGNIKIESKIKIGTKIYITLSKSRPANWYISEVFLNENQKMVVLDDDENIHIFWKQLYDKIHGINHGIELIHCYNHNEFLKILENNQVNKNDKFFMDLDIPGSKLNIFEILKKYKITKNSIIVTGRYYDKNVTENCDKYGVSLIPKRNLADTQFSVQNKTKRITLFVENDDLIRMGWESSAKSNNISLKAFANLQSFYNELEKHRKDIIIYLDSDLGEHEKGEEVARKLYNNGYENLYLATSYSPGKFKDCFWLKKIVDKTPPWEN
jgi:signal transduction histidine kinase